MGAWRHPRPPYHACVAIRLTGSRHHHNQVNHLASVAQCRISATSAVKWLRFAVNIAGSAVIKITMMTVHRIHLEIASTRATDRS